MQLVSRKQAKGVVDCGLLLKIYIHTIQIDSAFKLLENYRELNIRETVRSLWKCAPVALAYNLSSESNVCSCRWRRAVGYGSTRMQPATRFQSVLVLWSL